MVVAYYKQEKTVDTVMVMVQSDVKVVAETAVYPVQAAKVMVASHALTVEGTAV